MKKLDESIFEKNSSLQEGKVVQFWKDEKIAERSVSERPDDETFTMFNGPPFVTGLPHHGHLLAHTLQDVFPRYQTMRGKRVEKKFGWDCHGVPVESIAKEELAQEAGPDKKTIIDFDIKVFNDKCRAIVQRFSSEWQKTEERIGRWIDMENPYMTMDVSFMESVWSSFKSLHEKGYIYRDKQVLDYSAALHTVLSTNETDQKEIPCTTATVKFASGSDNLLAWTTTPWTLPSNRGLAVNPNISYVTLESEMGRSIVSERYYESNKHEFPGAKIADSCLGKDLVGRRYAPLFPSPETSSATDSYKVVSADFVEEASGTGIVHIAPAFGADDYRVGKENNLEIHDPFNDNGERDESIPELRGKLFFKTDAFVLDVLEKNGFLFKKEKIMHMYPHCPRTNLPLMKRLRDSWFFDVEKIKERSIELAQGINWAPDGGVEPEFLASLNNIERWGLSRDRYWGTPIPMWFCEETGEYLCVGSIRELEELSGKKVNDLHYDVIGDLTIEKNGRKYVLKREIFDCWFESGSMPYGQTHYPFENKEKTERSLPADFIAEGRDQTRLWFQKLHLLSVALHDKPAFKNVVTNGILLAADGSKMAKSAKNYKSPEFILDTYGADALRFYLMHSPASKGERVRFDENDVKIVQNKIMRPMWNVAKFFVTKINAEGWSAENRTTQPGMLSGNEHEMDRWLYMRFEEFKKNVTSSYDSFNTMKACNQITQFLDELSNWYIRLSRKRFFNPDGYSRHYEILNDILIELSQLTAPIMPFISENIYKTVSQKESVHLTLWPESHVTEEDIESEATLRNMPVAMQITEMSNSIRSDQKIRIRQPLSEMRINVAEDFPLEKYAEILEEELNVIAIRKAEIDDLVFSQDPRYKTKKSKNIELALCCEITPELAREGMARDIIRSIQDSRKKMKYNLDDRVELIIEGDSDVLATHLQFIAESVNGVIAEHIADPEFNEQITMAENTFTVRMKKIPLPV